MVGKDEVITVGEAVAIIQQYMVNRTDRYGHYHRNTRAPEAGMTRPYLAPWPHVIARAKAKGKAPPFLGEWQVTDHVEQRGLPVGVLAISTQDTCKWIAWDIDRHGDDIPHVMPEAARDSIVKFVEETLRLQCIVEHSGGGWHIWLPLADAARSQHAYELVQAVCPVGEQAWRALDGKGAEIEGYPKARSHANGGANCGGNWLRLPGC